MIALGLGVYLLAGVCLGQRPPYVSKPFSYPGVLPQYTTEDALGDRFDGSTTTSTTTPATRLPGSLHEQDTINRVSEWPKEKQPFWFVNNQQIADHRGFQKPNATESQTGGDRSPNGGSQESSAGNQSQEAGLQSQPEEINSRFQSGGAERQPADDEAGWIRPGFMQRNRINRNF